MERLDQERNNNMNVFILKSLALVFMIIDHYGAIFYSGTDIYRIIGRLAFPIYCFLLVEGYLYTRNIEKYAKRLLVFAIISEIPFDLSFYNGMEFMHQNIFFTLLIGLGTMYFLDNGEKYNIKRPIVPLIGAVIAIILKTDYNFIGILYILAFYYTRELPKLERLVKLAIIIFSINLITLSFYQQFALLSLPIMYFYNGKLGPNNKTLQALFYLAYPLHLLVFCFIRNI